MFWFLRKLTTQTYGAIRENNGAGRNRKGVQKWQLFFTVILIWRNFLTTRYTFLCHFVLTTYSLMIYYNFCTFLLNIIIIFNIIFNSHLKIISLHFYVQFLLQIDVGLWNTFGHEVTTLRKSRKKCQTTRKRERKFLESVISNCKGKTRIYIDFRKVKHLRAKKIYFRYRFLLFLLFRVAWNPRILNY